MTQIFVVVKQAIIGGAIPIAAYSDYPSALAYAQTIFDPTMMFNMRPTDLVFMIALSPAAAVAAPATPTTTS